MSFSKVTVVFRVPPGVDQEIFWYAMNTVILMCMQY